MKDQDKNKAQLVNEKVRQDAAEMERRKHERET